jgi:hypothetical protein
MRKKDRRDPASEGSEGPEPVAVGAQVRVFPGTDRELSGTVVDDFGDEAGQPVRIGAEEIVTAARRWAVQTGDGALVFVDDADITR